MSQIHRRAETVTGRGSVWTTPNTAGSPNTRIRFEELPHKTRRRLDAMEADIPDE